MQGVWDICLVQGEGRGKSTSKRDLTTPQIYPRGILSSTSLHGRNDYPDSQVELKFFTLCFFGSSAIICTLQELSEPTNIHCIPPHTSYLGQHTPLCPRLPSPAISFLGAPGLGRLLCSGWVPLLWHQTVSVKTQARTHTLSRSASATPFCISVSSSLKWG